MGLRPQVTIHADSAWIGRFKLLHNWELWHIIIESLKITDDAYPYLWMHIIFWCISLTEGPIPQISVGHLWKLISKISSVGWLGSGAELALIDINVIRYEVYIKAKQPTICQAPTALLEHLDRCFERHSNRCRQTAYQNVSCGHMEQLSNPLQDSHFCLKVCSRHNKSDIMDKNNQGHHLLHH